MKNLKSDKGSITLFILVGCIFFIASVVGVLNYMDNKEIAVDREYLQIKASYEQDINNMESIYDKLANINAIDGLEINFEEDENNKILVTIDTTNFNIKTIKYSWYYSQNELGDLSSCMPESWIFVETASDENSFFADESNNQTAGFYYLCVIVTDNLSNEKQEWYSKPKEVVVTG